MSYYFCIVGTRDNPLYQADLASKPSGASGAASFFSSASSSSSTAAAAAAAANKQLPGTPGGGNGGSASGGDAASSSGGSVFGFGNALGALAGGLSAARDARNAGTAGIQAAGIGGQAAGVNGDGKGLGFGRYNDKHVLQMIAHSSLDVIEDKQFTNNGMYLKAVDRINEWTTSAFIAPGNIKFLILHEHKLDDGIRNFFYDVWELVVKIMMNPFHDLNEPIRSASFDAKIRASARKHL